MNTSLRRERYKYKVDNDLNTELSNISYKNIQNKIDLHQSQISRITFIYLNSSSIVVKFIVLL